MKQYSIAIFGSSLREDYDKYSDKDLLIVAESNKDLKELREQYEKDNWSLSCYTYGKLKALSTRGNLFIQHLKDEAIISIDLNGKLQEILHTHTSKNDYFVELENTKNYFKILKFIPDSTIGYAWYCDCCYVGLRNYLIFESANKNNYEFSFKKLTKKLLFNQIIDNNDLDKLNELRVVKRNYREAIYDEFPSKDFTKEITEIFMKLKLIDSSKFLKPKSFQNYIKKNILTGNFDAYQRLRLLEGSYISSGKNIPKLKKIISNPQDYTNNFKSKAYTQKLINEVHAESFKFENSHSVV